MDYGYSKPVNLGEVPNHGKREKFGFKFPVFGCQLCALMFQAYGNCNCSSEHGKRAMLKSFYLKAFLILAQTISACSTSARKQDDLRQLATRSTRWTSRVPDLSNQTARDNISSRSDQFQLAVHLFGGPFNPT
uniref:Uncharacterized protein n=1 Tax=Brassica oleracea var. oleracea TaxID=109376 RepID=A0A0D3ADY1_BRAOL